jgi:hypothetical protein
MNVPGIPEGYELVRIGKPKADETCIDLSGALFTWKSDAASTTYAIVRKLPEPLKLREGAWYERRDGKVVGPAKKHNHEYFPYICGHRAYKSDGRYSLHNTCDVDLIREVDPPKPTHRPFANADEFAPHRDKWMVSKEFKHERFKASTYTDKHVAFPEVVNYVEMFEKLTFENGEPCGVRVE